MVHTGYARSQMNALKVRVSFRCVGVGDVGVILLRRFELCESFLHALHVFRKLLDAFCLACTGLVVVVLVCVRAVRRGMSLLVAFEAILILPIFLIERLSFTLPGSAIRFSISVSAPPTTLLNKRRSLRLSRFGHNRLTVLV